MVRERPRGEAKWRARIKEQEQSGEPIRVFCERRGIERSGFYAWRRRFREEAAERGSRFMPVEVVAAPQPVFIAPPVTDAGVEVVLKNGRRLRLARGFDREVLAVAVGVLEAASC